MFRTSSVIAACVVAVVCLPVNVSAGGLFGRLNGGSNDSVLGVVGGRDSDALITLGEGDAGDRGLVNVGLGGGDGELVDVEIGSGDTPLVDAEVSVGGSGGLVKVDTNVGGGLIDADVTIGGGRDVLDVDVVIDPGDGGNGGGPLDGDGDGNGDGGGGNGGGDGDGGGKGGSGGSNGGGKGGNNGGGSGTNNGGITGGNGGGVSGRPIALGGGGVSCSGTDTGQLVDLFQNTRMQNWDRARDVQVMPIRVCPQLRSQMAEWLISKRSYHQMVGAVADHRMITETLSQNNFQPGHVLAVHDAGNGRLMVYVF